MLKKLMRDPFSRNWLISFLCSALVIAFATLGGCTPGPGDGVQASRDIVMHDIEPIKPAGEGKVETHPWLHKEFWQSIADDDTAEYNFECAFGLPFIRRDSHPPIFIDQGATGRPMEKRIKRMLWEVCGDMTWKEWSDGVNK